MVEVGSLRAMIRATRSDAVVLIVSFLVTVVVDLITAVPVGVAIAVVLAFRSVSPLGSARQVPLDPADHDGEEHNLPAEHIVAYRIDGPLFRRGTPIPVGTDRDRHRQGGHQNRKPRLRDPDQRQWLPQSPWATR
jgi:hypothetical protein